MSIKKGLILTALLHTIIAVVVIVVVGVVYTFEPKRD